MKKLLIADDQAGIRMLLGEVFKNEGYETILAANGNEAAKRLQEDRPDCLLMDMKMPGISGDVLLQQVKSCCPEFPVIMITAYDRTEQPAGQVSYEADYYFTKPFDIHEIRRTVNELMKEK